MAKPTWKLRPSVKRSGEAPGTVGHGDADKDWSAVALVARRRAGLDGGTRRR